MLTCRTARRGDAPAVHAIRAAAAADLTARFGEGHWSRVARADRIRDKADGSLHLIEQDASPVATFVLTDRKIGFYRAAWVADPKHRAGYLLHLAVHPSLQRTGIGRYAIGQAEQLARSGDLQALRFDAYRGEVGASAFYLKCGYRLVHSGEIRGVELDYFEKTLGVASP
jgi:GNAT superfamily N-acetyltransferase